MHNLNFTRLIGLVFLCSRLILRAKATDLPECTFGDSDAVPCNDSSGDTALTSTTYCIDTSGKIYKSTKVEGGTPGSCVLQNGTLEDIKIFECSDANTCSVANLSTAGSIVVYKKGTSSWSKYDKTYYYYEPESGTKVLFSLESSVWKKLSTSGKYYLLTSSNSNKSENKVIKVSSSSTGEVNLPTNNAYIDAGDSTGKSVITCDEGTCTAAEPRSGSSGVYFDASDTGGKKIITCDGTNNCIQAPSPSGYYLNAIGETLIFCDATNGCTQVDGRKGYFVGATAANNPSVIKCPGDSSAPCSAYTLCNSTKKPGCMESATKLCLTEACSNTADFVTFPVSAVKYKSINLAADTDFPGAGDTGSAITITVKVNTDGSVLLLEEQADSCKTTCITETITPKLYYCNAACGAIVSGTDIPAFAYQCSGNTASTCKLAKGIVKIDSTYYKCSGWKEDPCTPLTAEACSNNSKLGDLGNNAVCFGTNSLAFPAAGKTTIGLFINAEVNPTFGLGASSGASSNVVAVAVTSTSALVTEVSEAATGYHLNLSVSGAVTNALIKCETAGSCTPVDAKNGYYINGDGSEASKQLIQCSSAGCSIVPANKGYYIDASKATTRTNPTYPGLIKCNEVSSNDPTIKCESKNGSEGFYISGTVETNKKTNALVECTVTESVDCVVRSLKTSATNSIFINNDDPTKVIKCDTTNGCVSSESGGTAEAPKYFVNGGKSGDLDISPAISNSNYDKLIIKCDNTNCQLINAAVNNIYINYDLQRIIRCTSNVCTAVENDSTPTSSAYYKSADANGKLIKCMSAPVGCKEITNFDDIIADGDTSEFKVFLNSNFKTGADTTNQLIKCKKGGSSLCNLGDSHATVNVPEFYVNGDLDNNKSDYDGPFKTEIIKCVKVNNSATCTAETVRNNDIFINGNFGYEDNPNQIIKCEANGCVEAPGYPGRPTTPLYYVNAGHANADPLQDTLIQCTSSSIKCKTIVARNEEIFINANDNQLILCRTDNGCVATTTRANNENNEFYLNSNDLRISNDLQKLKDDLIKCSLDTTSNTNVKKCEPVDGKENAVYVNAFNTAEVIYCLSNVGCKKKASQATETRPEYYVNGDDIDFGLAHMERDGNPVDLDKLNGDLIECKVNGSVKRCAVINGRNGDIYINSNYNKETVNGIKLGEEVNQLIQCTTDEGCIAVGFSELGESEDKPTAEKPFYYVNSGNKATPKFKDALIKCTAEDAACGIITAHPNEVYISSNDKENLQKPLIMCGKVSCATAVSAATKENKEYYLNAGKVSEQPLTDDIIECSVKSTESGADVMESTVCKLLKKDGMNIESGVGIYLNSNYAESGDNKQLIQCTEENGCVGIKSESSAKIMEYYVNAESSDSLDNALIYCSNNRCEKKTPESVPMYFVGKDTKNDVDGLIECKEVEKTTPEPDTVTKCAIKSAFTSQGYYLNSGQNKATNQVILCDSSDGCASLKVDLGYYVNAGNEEKKIIKCEREGSECSEIQSPECPSDEEIVAGSYCYEGDTLKFYPSNDSTAITASKSDDSYAFATIQANIFPGIRQETSALFKISRYFINRYFQSGVILIDKNGKLVDSLDGDQSDITLYDCNDSSKTCNEKQGCTSDTYMFDAENKKALFCNDGKLEYAQFTGYVLDSNRVTTGSKHPYIIHCKNNGKKCESIKPKTSIDTYYENSGFDATTNALIQCGSNNCRTVTASAGYYVGHGEDGYSGIIKCTSTNSCTYSQVKSKVKYVNAGENKNTYAIIDCNKVNGCNVAKANIGYYLTHTSTLLIQCTSPTTCTEFTPTVNYFDNADSSESSNTIINCVQNSSIITCSAVAANNGYYLTSSPSILIRCKPGVKCKSITVITNGIFRSALKGLTSSNNNSNNSNNNSNNNARDVEERAVDAMEDNLEEDGKSVMMRDSDEAYGIIRCVSGKCEALSANEVAAIPICEFNNNKCYITLEYSMTKSATTSITAGNICTNGDRSIFYFATDTIVVKPNVISGVTATYIYTTTNSNCLEVNDSYNDMYFTVGSNIYNLAYKCVIQFYNTGYYFINVDKNTLVKGNDIDAYNDDNVKLYRCNGSACSIVDKPESVTYYADVNKRILKYNVNNDAYTFAYEKDITCIFNNNKCTPNSDMKSHEFCITYKGEIVLARNDIKNRETGECFRSNSMNANIYGYSQYLYVMNEYAAQMVDQTGYYIVSLSTNTTVVSKNYKTKNSNIIVYGCTMSSCKIYEPDKNTYYYDERAKNILRYKNGVWKVPSTSGYAYVSIDPTNTYVYKFTKKDEEITIQNKANYGYYYTVDDEMFLCEEGSCAPITENGYFFTNVGEVYYCVHDSEGLEVTECTRQYCISGQYYSINDAYYRCENSSILTPVVSRYCSYDDNVIINYPLAFNEELPDKIKQAVNGIESINNSTAIITYRKNFLESVSGIFTNCTYNVEDTKSTFDLVCINNYVSVDKESNKVKICSIEQLGYVECVEDEENPEKCKVSAAYIMKPSIFVTLIVLFFAMLYHLY